MQNNNQSIFEVGSLERSENFLEGITKPEIVGKQLASVKYAGTTEDLGNPKNFNESLDCLQTYPHQDSHKLLTLNTNISKKLNSNFDLPDESKESPLYIAAYNGYLEVVAALIESGAILDLLNNEGWTPLHAATNQGHLKVVTTLIAAGASIDLTDNGGWTALNIAAQNGDLQVVIALIAAGAALNLPNNNGCTPLNSAAGRGKAEIVTALIAAGAAVNLPNNNGWSPLNKAAGKGHLEIVDILINSGAAFEIPNNDGWTPLHTAANKGYFKIINLLIAVGAKIESIEIDGKSPLHLAAQNGHLEVVTTLIAAGAEIDLPDNDGWTPLHAAADNGHKKIITALIAAGAVIDLPDNNVCTPLHIAVNNGHFEIVKALIAAGSAVNIPDDDGCTPLYTAASKGFLEIVAALIAVEVTIDKPDNNGWTPLHASVYNGHIEVVIALIAANADITRVTKDGASVFSVACDDLTILKVMVYQKLLNLSERLFPQNPTTKQLFINWIKEQVPFEQLIDFIIEHHGHLNATPQDRITLLMIAIATESYEETKKLLITGVDKGRLGHHIDSLLHYACAYGSPQILELLLEQGCSLDLTNPNYPELWAVKKDNVENLQIIINWKINMIQSDIYYNILDTAKYYNASKCIAYLYQLIEAKKATQIFSQGDPDLHLKPNDLKTPIISPILFAGKLQNKELLLENVAYGKQQAAETILLQNPQLAFLTSNVTDHAGRNFEGITALQYATWALDYRMVNMLLKYIPEVDIKKQLSTMHKGTWISKYGNKINWQNLIRSFQEYVANYSHWSMQERTSYWLDTIVRVQLFLPVHVRNEYSGAQAADPYHSKDLASIPAILTNSTPMDDIVQITQDLQKIMDLLNTRSNQIEQFILKYTVINKMAKLQIS